MNMFRNPAGTSSNVQRQSISPEEERKLALMGWRNRGFNEGFAGTSRYTDAGILAVAGRDALSMYRRGKRLGAEKRARDAA